MSKYVARILLGAAAVLLVGGSVQAQTASPAPPSDVSRQGGDLSDKLNSTNGVIHPETPVDPKMQKQTPQTGTMSVVPPPGSPGGAQGVIPK